jgi:hypothetical protein
MKARKKPIDVMAVHYTHNVDLDKFLELLRTNEEEPIRYDDLDKTIYIQKERGEIALKYGDWVIFEENTDKCFWAINHDIFLKTYVRVPNTVNTFVKKVYEVDCVEFKSLKEHDVIDVLDFVGYQINQNEPLTFLQRNDLIEEIKEQGYIVIKTLEGDEKLYPTEVLIRGVEGEYYPVKRVNFDKVYDVIIPEVLK